MLFLVLCVCVRACVRVSACGYVLVRAGVQEARGVRSLEIGVSRGINYAKRVLGPECGSSATAVSIGSHRAIS